MIWFIIMRVIYEIKSVIDSITKYNMSNVNVLSMFQKKKRILLL